MSDEDRDHRDVHANQERYLARESEWEALDEDLDRYFDEERHWPATRPVSAPMPLLTYTERELLAAIVSKVAAAYVLIGSDRAALQLTVLAAKVRP